MATPSLCMHMYFYKLTIFRYYGDAFVYMKKMIVRKIYTLKIYLLHEKVIKREIHHNPMRLFVPSIANGRYAFFRAGTGTKLKKTGSRNGIF